MMSAKPLVIVGSARKESDTSLLARKLFSPGEADLLDLLDYTLHHYRYDGNYPLDDQFLLLLERIQQHERLVFATPVYWYAMSGLMKVLFDRLTDLVTIRKQFGRSLVGKQTFLLAVGADDTLPTGFEVPFQATSDYLAMEFKGTYYCKNSEIDVKEEKAIVFKQLVSARNESR
jgi:multimeric flavodoxin WrbA